MSALIIGLLIGFMFGFILGFRLCILCVKRLRKRGFNI